MHHHKLSRQGEAANDRSEKLLDASCREPADRLAAARGIILGLGLGLAFWMAVAAGVIAWFRRG